MSSSYLSNAFDPNEDKDYSRRSDRLSTDTKQEKFLNSVRTIEAKAAVKAFMKPTESAQTFLDTTFSTVEDEESSEDITKKKKVAFSLPFPKTTTKPSKASKLRRPNPFGSMKSERSFDFKKTRKHTLKKKNKKRQNTLFQMSSRLFTSGSTKKKLPKDVWKTEQRPSEVEREEELENGVFNSEGEEVKKKKTVSHFQLEKANAVPPFSSETNLTGEGEFEDFDNGFPG